jgi:hypothetical protein
MVQLLIVTAVEYFKSHFILLQCVTINKIYFRGKKVKLSLFLTN